MRILFTVVVTCMLGLYIQADVVAQQYYNQSASSSCPSCQSSPVVNFSGNMMGTASNYGVNSQPVYSTPASYSTTSNYAIPAYSSAPVTYSSPVNYAPQVSYLSPSASIPMTNSSNVVMPQTVQSYPSGTYASPVYSQTTAIPQTYTSSYSSSVQPSYSQPMYSQPITYSQPVSMAQPVNVVQPNYTQPARYSQQVYSPTNYSTSNYSSGNQYSSTGSGLAQQKAVRAAQMGLRGHLGGGLGGAKFEGVGWSNQSAQRAIESCCYWGQRPTAQIGCTRGADGFWYACVLYN